MPTNPLWIEHTEKAAWETVRALREQVEEERARADRLLRLEPTLPRLAELLDEAREAFGVEAHAPAVILEQLFVELRKLREERAALERELQARPAPSSPAIAVSPAPVATPSERSTKKPSAARWFVSQLERRRREREAEDDLEPARGSLAEVAAQVEERLRQLVPLPYAPAALRTAALDLGLAALDLARAARRAERAG